MFDINSAIKDALADFARFKREMVATNDPATISPELIKSVQTMTKQACQALGLASTFGAAFKIPIEIKDEVRGILHYFLNDPDGKRKLALLSKQKEWDFEKYFTKLNQILMNSK